jgi:hypothetical protein
MDDNTERPEIQTRPTVKSTTRVLLAVLVVGSIDLIAYLALQGASSPVRVAILAGLPPIALALGKVVSQIAGTSRPGPEK